jgi:hypothetical protein
MRSGYITLVSQVRQYLEKHLLAINAVMESMLTSLDGARDVVESQIENHIPELPGHNFFVGVLSKCMPVDQLVPQSSLVRHHLLQ